MKKIVAVLLTFAFVFAFAACKNNEHDKENGESTNPTTTGKPGAVVTNASGEAMTTGLIYVMPDENGKPMTQLVTDEYGSQKSEIVTTVVYDIWTYPGATQPATVPAGNTMAHLNKDWPTNEFMAKVPALDIKLSDVTVNKNEDGELATLFINDMSYADFVKYVDECKAAGFAQTAGSKLAQEEEPGETYMYYSEANGLYLNLIYNTDTAPYRTCDVKIIVSNYDLLGD